MSPPALATSGRLDADVPGAGAARSAGLSAERTGVRDWIWLVVIWATVTAYNIFKPYHIDDTAHLEIARWIQSHPLHPMSGMLNWSGYDEPIWRTNQPHLYFYMLAAWGRVFGFSEPSMHAMQALPAFACILLFYRLASTLAGDRAIWATAMLALGPAFVVEQNLMVDVTLLATWLAFFNLLICDLKDRNQVLRYGLAGLACAAALLVKYSSLVLLLILCISLVAERRRSQAWTVLIPVGALAAWSLFNYSDYGGVHIASRPHAAARSALTPFKFVVAWFVGLGALTPLGVIAAVQSRSGWVRAGWFGYAAVGAGFTALIAAVALGRLNDGHADKILWLAFLINAALICLALANSARGLAKLRLWRRDAALEAAPAIYLWLWLGGTTAFYVLLSPFIAARHVLLILPPVILLLLMRWGGSLSPASKTFGLALTLVVSGGLCLSDWRFAAFYRAESVLLARSLPRTGGPIWTSGHWGWQWYAEQNGFRQVDVRASRFHPGDLLIAPQEVDHQPLTQRVSERLVSSATETEPLLSLFCTGRSARFYAFDYRQGPWSLSRNCLNHIDVFRLTPDGPARAPTPQRQAVSR